VYTPAVRGRAPYPRAVYILGCLTCLGSLSAFAAAECFGNSTEWMLGRTPPSAMVVFPRSAFSSSSFL
jgi:hypothetical protein